MLHVLGEFGEAMVSGRLVRKSGQMSGDRKTDKGHIEEGLMEMLRRLILYH